jgi:hypothetical protein
MTDTPKIPTSQELFEMRVELLEQYGEKIIHGGTERMTPKEKEACADYELLTNILHHLDSHTIIIDKLTELYAPIARLFHKGKTIVFHDL